MGSPSSVLGDVELGPSHGTMIADALRALGGYPAPLYQLNIGIASRSIRWCREKRKRPPGSMRNIDWHDSFDDVPEGSGLSSPTKSGTVLPIHQAVNKKPARH